MRGATLAHVERAVARIHSEPRLPEEARLDLLAAAHLLGGYHFPARVLEGIITKETLMQSPTYLAITAEASLATSRRLALRRLEQTFGAVPPDLRERLDATTDEAVLDRVHDALGAADRDAVLTAVRQVLRLDR